MRLITQSDVRQILNRVAPYPKDWASQRCILLAAAINACISTQTERERWELGDKLSSVEVCRAACSSAEGRAALYHLVGEIRTLPSYNLIPPDDHAISVKQLLQLIEDLQTGKRR